MCNPLHCTCVSDIQLEADFALKYARLLPLYPALPRPDPTKTKNGLSLAPSFDVEVLDIHKATKDMVVVLVPTAKPIVISILRLPNKPLPEVVTIEVSDNQTVAATAVLPMLTMTVDCKDPKLMLTTVTERLPVET